MSCPYVIVQHFDQPMRIIIWTVDDFVVAIVPFFIFMFIYDAPVFAIIYSVVMTLLMQRLKAHHGRQRVLCFLYWYFPQVIRFRVILPSYIRQCFG